MVKRGKLLSDNSVLTGETHLKEDNLNFTSEMSVRAILCVALSVFVCICF